MPFECFGSQMGAAHVTLAEAISSVHITEVWDALGLGPVRHRRGRAFWRNGDGFNVSLDDQKSARFDYVQGKGGGVLDLITLALECDRAGAVAWLSETFALDIDQQRRLTTEEKRRYARAQAEAEMLLAWRAAYLDDLREQRNFHLRMYHTAIRFILSHSLNHPNANAVSDVCERHEHLYHELDQQIDTFRAAKPEALIPLFREQRWRRAA